ncbi:MAG: DUF192 domain-containing protein [Bdellovibrionales bacterium]|nr:DUF192 domain-containing protein [Bdellovibrionales bacterium]
MPTNQKKKRLQHRQIIFLLVLLVAAFLGLRQYGLHVERKGKLSAHFELPSGEKTAPFYLEIASTDAQRQKGLMYRKDGDLAPDDGMLFIFPKTKDQRFWMKNTYVSLDMLFVDKDFQVVGILPDVPILNTELRGVDTPSLYVVELLAGTTQKHRIEKGSRLVVEGHLPRAVG